MQSNWLREISKTYFQLNEWDPAPKREDSATDAEHSAKLRKWAANEKEEAEAQRSIAKTKEAVLDVAIPVLKGVEIAADTALTAGTVLPGGMALNSAVKTAKAGLNAYQGDYVSAAANVLDAAVPYAGALKTTSTVAKTISSPVSTAINKAATPLIQKGVNVALPAASETTKQAITKGTASLVSSAGKPFNEPVKTAVASSFSNNGSPNIQQQKTEREKMEDRYNKSRFNL